ncbi:MAG: tetratricopeptide repeat protein [Hyphomonadaceae bacterium]|nr:tetratricopeptide repeat protein [Hyphomonadaceae bacterium]
MTDLFEEVEENLRRDQFQSLWKKYGVFAIGGAVALVLGVGGVGVYRSWQDGQSQAASETFAEIQQLAQTDPAAAAPKLAAFAKSGFGGYKALAEMERAGALQAEGDLPGALVAFDNAAKMSNEPAIKQSAQLRAAYIAAESENFTAIEARVQPLIADGGAFGYLGRELLGVEAYEAGQLDRARTEFSYLETAFDAPQGVRERAQQFLAVIGPAPETAPQTPAAPGAEKKTGEAK